MKSSIPEPKLYKINLEDFFNFLSFDQRIKEFIYKVQELAKKRGEFLYFVGGVVRDYLYFLKNSGWKKESIKDLDIVLQGDLKGFLEALLKEVEGKILFKSQFLTYKVKIHLNSEELLIDFITARKETYEDVAKLPKVFPSDFKDDVLRRDFTINTLIIGLSPPYEGYLIDLLNGIDDLEKGIIKPLHLNSFVDDPTRIFRGIRYKVRFEFEFSREFYIALEKSFEKEALKKLTPARIVNELKLYLNKEPRNKLEALLKITNELKIFEQAGIKIKRENIPLIVKILDELGDELSQKEKEKFFLLALIDKDFIESAQRLGFTEKELREFKKVLQRGERFVEEYKNICFEERIKFFEKIPRFYLLSLAVYFPELKEEIVRFIKVYSKIKPEITGDELKEMGVKSGKEIGRILKILKIKRIEGEIKNKNEEVEFVKQYVLKI